MPAISDDLPHVDAWLEEYDACHALLRKLNAIHTKTFEENKTLRSEVAKLDRRGSGVSTYESSSRKPHALPPKCASSRTFDTPPSSNGKGQSSLTLDILSREEEPRQVQSWSTMHSMDIECSPLAPERTVSLAVGIQDESVQLRGDSPMHRDDWYCKEAGNCKEETHELVYFNSEASPSRSHDQDGENGFTHPVDTPLDRWADLVYLLLNPDQVSQTHKPPPDLGIHRVWLLAKHRSGSSVSLSTNVDSMQSENSESTVARKTNFDASSLYIKSARHPLRKLVMDPTGRKPMVWGLLGALFISYDAVTLPLAFFDLPNRAQERFAQVNMLTLMYWVFDVVVQILMGFKIHGRIDMRPNKIIYRYMTTWFVPDLFLISLDLTLLSLTSFKGSSSLRIVRILRLMRLFRLLRIRRINTVMSTGKQLLMNGNSSTLQLTLSLMQNVILVLLVTHYIACIWFYVGWSSLHNINGYDSSWITATAIEASDVGTQYTLAFHWSLTQFSPATNNINPQNVIERAFACFVVMFAMVAFSSFISTVTSTVAQIRQVNAKRYAEEGLIKSFIHERHLSISLAYDIMQFFRANFNRSNARVHETDIKTFADLPERMLWRLHEEMYRHMWISNPLFYQFIGRDDRLIAKLSHETVSLQHYVAQQDVFCDESICHHSFYVTDGVSQYNVSAFRLTGPTSHVPRMSHRGDMSSSIRSGSWLSEMAFWVPWHHQGSLTCSTSSEFACVNCEKFGMSVSTYGGILHHMISVLAIYIIGYAEARIDIGERLTDLPMDEFEAEEIASRVSKFFGRSGNVDKVRGSIGAAIQ